MTEETTVVETTPETTPVLHKLGMATVGMLAAMVATAFTEKVYVAAVTAYRNRKSDTPDAE